MLEHSGDTRESNDFEVAAKLILKKAEENADLRTALGNPSYSVSLCVRVY